MSPQPYRPPPTRSFVLEQIMRAIRDDAMTDREWWDMHRRALVAFLRTPARVYDEEARNARPRA